ncbi:hypothetical protein I6A84_13025, partial [Frankia sp. CNm7]
QPGGPVSAAAAPVTGSGGMGSFAGMGGWAGGGAATAVAADEPSLDDEDMPAHPGAALSGEAAAVELLRAGLGATVIEQHGAS